MAVYLRSLGFAFVLQSLIALYVFGKEQVFLSVQAPVVYVVAGRSLPFRLDCIINGSSLSASRVSWKHERKWLHNQTQRLGTKVQLVLRKVKRQEDGIYQCSVFNVSGLSPGEVIPNDVNVTVLVGGPVSKPMCISNGLTPPKISLIWNAIDEYQSVLPFTYNVLYCHNPLPSNKFCIWPRHYNISRDCTGLSVNSNSKSGSMTMECNVTSLFKRLYPNLFDIHAEGDIIPKIYFSVNIGNVQSDAYSTKSHCNPLDLEKCTHPENIHVNNLKRKTLSLVWDAPNDMDSYKKLLRYEILHAADGAIHSNQSVDFVSRDFNQLVNLSYDIADLHPYTVYHIYIACSINSAYKDYTRGEFIGLSARTLEEKPSHYPTISDNFTSSILHGEYRNVTLHWKLPDNKTWNGIITHIELRYWKANTDRMSRKDNSTVVVLSNVSMTTGTLTNLRLDESYAVEAVMCTRVGCGPPSPSIPITRLDFPDGTPKPRTKEQGYFNVIIGVTFGLLLCIAFAVLVAYLWAKKSRRRRKQDKEKRPIAEVIGKLSPPPLYESENGPLKIEDSGDYDEAIEPLLCDDKECVQIKAPPAESLVYKRAQDDKADFRHCT